MLKTVLNVLVSASLLACASENKYNTMGVSFMNSGITSNEKIDTATFGTGCFWCTEAIFEQLNGVVKVTSGYSGGHVENPTYKQVCTGETGHAECVQILYEPEKISYDDLLEVFWQTHDPTTLNRQGADEGTQYRSAIFLNRLLNNVRLFIVVFLNKIKQPESCFFNHNYLTLLEKLTNYEETHYLFALCCSIIFCQLCR